MTSFDIRGVTTSISVLTINKKNPAAVCYLNSQISTEMFRFCTKLPGIPGVVFRVVQLPSEIDPKINDNRIEQHTSEPFVLASQKNETASSNQYHVEYPFQSLDTLDEFYLPLNDGTAVISQWNLNLEWNHINTTYTKRYLEKSNPNLKKPKSTDPVYNRSEKVVVSKQMQVDSFIPRLYCTRDKVFVLEFEKMYLFNFCLRKNLVTRQSNFKVTENQWSFLNRGEMGVMYRIKPSRS